MASAKGIEAANTIRVSDMEKMSVDQLRVLKEQSDIEVNLLQDSLNKIRTAATRLEIASTALHDLSLHPQGISLSLSTPFCTASSLRFLLLQVRRCLYLSRRLSTSRESLTTLRRSLLMLEPVILLRYLYFVMLFLTDKTMAEGKDYCERKINLLKSNFEELVEFVHSSLRKVLLDKIIHNIKTTQRQKHQHE
ncbi:putative prefoldin subunit 5 [Dendrobium catenatum]|uniref:Putative prefoldin subunit 5 n=1 Tax=Dendrobium catenatum TaxID=906689 RepID=A0A2I0WDJ8_9ASPA|nr:putative prefoldin subunit 5 [Dendrobium catenatum]